MNAEPPFSDRQFALVAKALSDPRRYRILSEIAATGTLACQAMRCGHMVSAATISHHIKELEAASLIEITREGKFATLRFRADTMEAYLAHMARTLNVPLKPAFT